MPKNDDVYNNVVLDIQYRDVNRKNIHGSLPTYEGGVLYEDLAFHKLPRKFSDELIKIIKDMKINKIPEKEIDLRPLFKLIEKSEVENFDRFFNFIQFLSNSSEKILTIKMGIECIYEEPIELIEFSNVEYQKVFHDTPYEDSLKEKIKNQCFSKSLEIIKNYVHELNNFGTLTIDPNLITEQMFIYDSDDSIIGHEIRHFIIFLQRWSKANYNNIKNRLFFGSFNNIFLEDSKKFDLEPCDVLHPIKQILIDKDGHDSIFSDDYFINESKFGFEERNDKSE